MCVHTHESMLHSLLIHSLNPGVEPRGAVRLASLTALIFKPAQTHRHVICSAMQALVETAMLAAVSGLAFVLATILRLDNTVGYFLPLPIMLAAMRSGPSSGWGTMAATGFLLVGE